MKGIFVRDPRPVDWYLKWAATVIVCLGAVATTQNMYPLGPTLFLVGTFLWLIVSIMWRETSLIVVNGFLLAIYVVGLVYRLLILQG